MKLSVIIVNYNVKYFLEQCLLSVEKAMQGLNCEVFVVDNNSVDGSVEMIQSRFQWVKLIANKKNTGFSAANNQAIEASVGEYVLLLNPDTLVQNDTFTKVTSFMDDNPQAGGLGVKMIDGKGNFLPESKRGLPTPEVAFYKIFGLAALFPKNKRFGKYHLSYLNRDEIHEIEVLSGAFMLLRKKALDEVGLLDEAFFMYGEDIDLSYRIIKGGYKNYYFPETSIIHYKGESTKKSSVNYVFVFYRAMVIFAQKHFSKGRANTFSTLINIAIYFRAAIAVLRRLSARFFIPTFDLIAGFFAFSSAGWLYAQLTEKVFNDTFYFINLPLYLGTWIFTIFLSGGYDYPLRMKQALKGVAVGFIAVLAIYGLLAEDLRFSRFLLFVFGVLLVPISVISRYLSTKLFPEKIEFQKNDKKRVGLVGSIEEYKRVLSILKQSELELAFTARIREKETEDKTDSIGTLSQLNDLIQIFKLDEVIFCSKDLSSNAIIQCMSHVSTQHIEFKIAPPESIYVIGSNSINRSGEYYSILNINRISSAQNKRSKWLFDKLISSILLLSYPLVFWIYKQALRALKNIFSIWIGKNTMVSYDTHDPEINLLPEIKPGVFAITDKYTKGNLELEQLHRINLLYAKDYSFWQDFQVLVKNFRRL